MPDGPYRSGKSRHGAPVRRIHTIPFSTWRWDLYGQPGLPVRSGGNCGSISAYCSSVKSYRPVTACPKMRGRPARLTGYALDHKSFRFGIQDRSFGHTLALLPTVEHVIQEANRRGIHVGQFVDDQALSGTIQDNRLISEVCKAFARFGFRISRRKIRVMRAGSRQTVTGHTVNSKVGIPRDERARIRAAIRELELRQPMPSPSDSKFRSVLGRVARLSQFHPIMGRNLLVRLSHLATNEVPEAPRQ